MRDEPRGSGANARESRGMNATEAVGALDQYAFVILPALLVAEQFGIPLRGVSQEYEGRARIAAAVRAVTTTRMKEA